MNMCQFHSRTLVCYPLQPQIYHQTNLIKICIDPKIDEFRTKKAECTVFSLKSTKSVKSKKKSINFHTFIFYIQFYKFSSFNGHYEIVLHWEAAFLEYLFWVSLYYSIQMQVVLPVSMLKTQCKDRRSNTVFFQAFFCKDCTFVNMRIRCQTFCYISNHN